MRAARQVLGTHTAAMVSFCSTTRCSHKPVGLRKNESSQLSHLVPL